MDIDFPAFDKILIPELSQSDKILLYERRKQDKV